MECREVLREAGKGKGKGALHRDEERLDTTPTSLTHQPTRKLRKLTQHRTNKPMTNETRDKRMQIRRAMRRSFETTHCGENKKQNSLDFLHLHIQHTVHMTLIVEAPHLPHPPRVQNTLDATPPRLKSSVHASHGVIKPKTSLQA